MDKQKFKILRGRGGPFLWVVIVMVAMIGTAYILLSTDTFIDVGDVTELAGNDLSLYDQQKMRKYSQDVIYGLFSESDESTEAEGEETTNDPSVYVEPPATGNINNGTGSGGEVVDCIGNNILVYSDSSGTGGFTVDARACYGTKGLSNYNNWAAWMYKCTYGGWNSNSNIRKCAGVVDIDGTLFDTNGKVVIAVGPAVMNPARNCMQQATAGEMRYGTSVDVVLERDGTNYYIHAVVGDCKAHTYPSGIIQTGYKVIGDKVGYVAPGAPDSTWREMAYDVTVAQSYKSNSVVEFCKVAENNLAGADAYSIVGFIVY